MHYSKNIIVELITENTKSIAAEVKKRLAKRLAPLIPLLDYAAAKAFDRAAAMLRFARSAKERARKEARKINFFSDIED